MTKSKLLYFVSEDKYFLTHKLSHGLAALKNGFDVLVICNISVYKKKLETYGFKVLNFPFNRKSINPIKEIIYAFKFLKILNKVKPDIVQCIALKPILYFIICEFFYKFSVQKIFAIVGLGYIFINKNFKTKFLKFVLLNMIAFSLKKKNSIVVFQNIDDMNYFLQRRIVEKDKVLIIPGSGVNTSYFKPRNVAKKYDLILHSRMLIDKGVVDIITALQILQKKEIFLKTLFLGNPDYNNLASIKTNELKLWNKQKLIVWIPEKKKILKYILQSRISILPSLREGFPKSLLEAASCGLPLISTDVPGCREICINNYNGLLVKKNNPQDLSIAIERLIKNKNKLKTFGYNSRKLVVENFSDKIISKQFLSLYNTRAKKVL